MANQSAVLAAYDEVQHDPLSTPPDLRGMEQDEAIAAIKEWFLANFEDPAQCTPYDGGYVYIWGGPYETRDIVENIFADTASDELIQAAIDDIDADGDIWVPNSARRQPPEDESEPLMLPDAAELHRAMLERIKTLEDALARVPQLPAGMGHNRPPEPLDAEPLTGEDRAELSNALAVLKAQPPEPGDNGKLAVEALTRLDRTRDKLREWLSRLGVMFTEEAIKEAGKQFGKWAPTAFWLWVLDAMFKVSQTASAWLKALQIPF